MAKNKIITQLLLSILCLSSASVWAAASRHHRGHFSVGDDVSFIEPMSEARVYGKIDRIFEGDSDNPKIKIDFKRNAADSWFTVVLSEDKFKTEQKGRKEEMIVGDKVGLIEPDTDNWVLGYIDRIFEGDSDNPKIKIDFKRNSDEKGFYTIVIPRRKLSKYRFTLLQENI